MILIKRYGTLLFILFMLKELLTTVGLLIGSAVVNVVKQELGEHNEKCNLRPLCRCNIYIWYGIRR